MAQSAFQKAADAYANTRQFAARIDSLEQTVADLTAQVADLTQRLRSTIARVEAQQPTQRRKAA